MDNLELWRRYREYLCVSSDPCLMLDISRINFPEGFFAAMEPAMQKAFAEMDALEKGAIANPDENRMVGHYWLRNPPLAPAEIISAEIEFNLRGIRQFAESVHDGA